MLHQIAEKLTVTDIQDSSPKNQNAFQGGVQGSGVSEATSKFNYDNDTFNSGQAGTGVNLLKGNNSRPTSQARVLYVQIRDDVAYQIIKHGLSKAESKLFFYFLLLDRFGDRPVKVKVAEILLETGVSKSAYHVAIAKFQKRGWFGFTHADVQITNFCTPTKKSRKQDSESRKQDSESRKQDSESKKQDYQSGKQDSEKLEPLPAAVSKTSQTLQTYSDLLHTLSEEMRESFEKFCLKKIQECSFKIGSRTGWLNKHGAEYLQEFKETYSYALANPEIIPTRKAPFDIPDIPELKLRYGDGWKDAAIHYGLIDPNSPEEEIQDESEPVASSEETEKPSVDSDHPQEPTPSTLVIGANHKQFTKGDRVVVAEVGNAHQGKTGKIIAARFGPKDDKYIIALDRKSPSVREITIKIPKGCTLTYLEAVAVGGVRSL
jgi:hypothetical protein